MTQERSGSLVAAVAAALEDMPPAPVPPPAPGAPALARRAALARRIVMLRAPLPEPVPAVEPAPQATFTPDPMVAQPVEPAPEPPKPPSTKRPNKVTFSSVSLDDAALLLAAASAPLETMPSGTVADTGANTTNSPGPAPESPPASRRKNGIVPNKDALAQAASALNALRGQDDAG